MSAETVTVRTPTSPSLHLAPAAPNPPGARTLCGRIKVADTVTVDDPQPMAHRCLACGLKDPGLGRLVSRTSA